MNNLEEIINDSILMDPPIVPVPVPPIEPPVPVPVVSIVPTPTPDIAPVPVVPIVPVPDIALVPDIAPVPVVPIVPTPTPAPVPIIPQRTNDNILMYSLIGVGIFIGACFLLSVIVGVSQKIKKNRRKRYNYNLNEIFQRNPWPRYE
jgi:hypothetical protein